jgi:hypothetical protein
MIDAEEQKAIRWVLRISRGEAANTQFTSKCGLGAIAHSAFHNFTKSFSKLIAHLKPPGDSRYNRYSDLAVSSLRVVMRKAPVIYPGDISG